jgi:tetratricopeptide (TPR) repeat protein
MSGKIRVDLPLRHSYLCRMSRSRRIHFCMMAAVVAWILLPLTGRPAQEERVTPDRPAEYMIYQYPDSILVLKFDVPEAEFSARTIGPENALIKSSAVPGRRIGPVYQYIDAVNRPRQLMIEVTPRRAVDRSAIGLEILQFGVTDRNVTTLVRAYQLFSVGAEAERSNAASTWGMKAYSMRNAAGFFAQLGMEEMSLWSEYFAAHLVLQRLDDPLMARELAEAVLQGASRARFEKVELAARILEGDALLRLAREAGDRSARTYFERAHEVLAEVARLAEEQGLKAELGRALYHDGRVHELAGEPEPALERYRQALAVIAVSGDDELLNEVRSTSAAVYESVGSTAGAIEMLDDISRDLAALPQGDADLELAGRLLEKGRLLNDSFRFAEAIPELSRALALQQSKGDRALWAPTGLELAWAYHSLGDADRALQLLNDALPVSGPYVSTGAVARAYGSLAQIHRMRGQFAELARAREKQGELLAAGDHRAAFLLESALDARVRDGAGSAQAQELMRRARQNAAQSGRELVRQRANLHLCLLQAETSRAEACELADAVASFDALQKAGAPSAAADASLVQSHILREAGRLSAARDVMDRLIDDLYWFRRALPGVLGAWYAEHRAEIARDYLALARAGKSTVAGDVSDGRALLLAMGRLRMLEQADFSRPGEQLLTDSEQEPLRSLLARREAAVGAEAAALGVEVNRQLGGARRKTGAAGDVLSDEDLARMLAGLGRSNAVLSYYFDGSQSQALVARQDGVRAVNLPAGGRIQGRLNQFRDLASGPHSPALAELLDELGRSLLGPVVQDLPVNVYLLPVGSLRGVPVDAMRVDGRLFLQDHRLVNLATLSSIERRGPRMQNGYREKVFLAGNPQVQNDPFSLDLRVSPEIAAVTEQFVGPGLHIVQGVALQRHEFEDERFTEARLIHLALAGTVDLGFPDRSRLLLAPPMADFSGAGAYLEPKDVRGFNLAAQLAMLSGTAMVGEGDSPADGRLAFVADLLEAGVASVVVSLWPAGEEVNAGFVTDLYRRLQVRPDIEAAFLDAKRARAERETLTNLQTWAGFQLFIR